MASALVRELLDAGIHFGHHCSRWNPKMAPYIYSRRNSIHIIDIRETLRGLLRAQKFLARVCAGGEDVLFVGTKRQARETVRAQAERCGMHYVNERWLGGTLTNFRTIRSRLERLEELELLVDSPQWETDYSKKRKSALMRELRKIRRNLSGIRKMEKLPGAMVVVDVRKEFNALREARNVGIPTICMLDTDSNPDFASIAIPANDDGMRGIELILTKIADAIEEGKRAQVAPPALTDDQEGPGPAGSARRRPRRPTTSASVDVEAVSIAPLEPPPAAPAPAREAEPVVPAKVEVPDAATVGSDPETSSA